MHDTMFFYLHVHVFLNLFGHMDENMETESLWDETIDDIALSQATNEIECEYLFGELSHSHLLVFDIGNFDEDNLQCEQEETVSFAFIEDP